MVGLNISARVARAYIFKPSYSPHFANTNVSANTFRTMKLNKNHIEIKFFDFSITHDEVTTILGLIPTHKWMKDEEYFVGPKKIKKIRKGNFWGHELYAETNDFIGDQVEEFLKSIIAPRTSQIKELTDKYHGEFSVVQYMYDGCNPGLYFDKGQLKILNDCGLELNIDIYVLTDIEKNETSA
jgi:hypothetical protein